MRRFLLGLVLLAACGGGDKATGITRNSTLIFKLDAQTCTGSGTLQFYLDGNSLGTASMVPGNSQTYTGQAAGQHSVGANEVRAGGYVWAPAIVTIPDNASYTHLLTC